MLHRRQDPLQRAEILGEPRSPCVEIAGQARAQRKQSLVTLESSKYAAGVPWHALLIAASPVIWLVPNQVLDLPQAPQVLEALRQALAEQAGRPCVLRAQTAPHSAGDEEVSVALIGGITRIRLVTRRRDANGVLLGEAEADLSRDPAQWPYSLSHVVTALYATAFAPMPRNEATVTATVRPRAVPAAAWIAAGVGMVASGVGLAFAVDRAATASVLASQRYDQPAFLEHAAAFESSGWIAAISLGTAAVSLAVAVALWSE